MPKTKVEVYDKDQLIYPYIESDHVTFSNGMKVSEMLDQSISMPTVAHEDLSFKVGVGDQDVSSAIVDSSVAEMTIKGKTYQNILPEPSTHVLTNNKEMFKVNEGLDPNVEIVDGVSKSAILKGQTLVNIRGKAVSTQADYIDYEVYGLQNNTTYTIVVESTDTNVISVVGFLKDTGRWNCETSPRTQNCKIVLTTTSAELMGRVRIRKDNKQDASQAIQIRVMVLEGDYRNVDIPYFEGMQSVKMPVLQTVGKNLFDKVSLGLGGNAYTNTVEYLPQLNNNTRATLSKGKLITVEPNSTVTLSCDNRFKCVIQEYDENENRTKSGDKGWQNGGSHTLTVGEKTNKINIYFAKQDPHSSEGITDEELSLLKNSIQMETSSSKTSYEPYKTNILHTPEEVVLRSLPNGVKDTLNLMTGEYVQRIGEITYTGKDTEGWRESVANYESDDIDSFYTYIHNPQSSVVSRHCHCNLFPVYHNLPSNPTFEYFHILNVGSSQIVIGIKRSKLSSQDLTGIKAWLQANPLTIQYELATPIIKTVNLSSSGNWEKIILNGSENWTQSTANNNYFMETSVIKSNYNTGTENLVFSGDHRLSVAKIYTSNTNTGLCIEKGGGLRIRTQQVLGGQSIEDFKAYLSQNPVMVYYQTKNHQDSTQVKQPIFFKDGHIQLSSGTDNSLIPTLDYQAKTSNSYVMDLMKTNTKYTMKAKSASGTFTIDGTSYGAVTNGTFTTPSSMTNKFLVMNNKTNEEVMILEGDVVSKTIPYFKGIKSAFEGESQIEVLSTGANIVDYLNPSFVGSSNMSHLVDNGEITLVDDATQMFSFVHIPINKVFNFKKGQKYHLSFEMQMTNALVGEVKIATPNVMARSNIFRYEINNEWTVYNTTITPQLDFSVNSLKQEEKGYETCLEFMLHGGTALSGKKTLKIRNVILSTNIVPYEPYKSNSTKIPLLSPLRSLPNGVCDELIIDRMKNKAILIQRIDYIQLSGEHWTTRHSYSDMSETMSFFATHSINNFKNANYGMLSQQFQTYQRTAEDLRHETQSYIWNGKTGGTLVYVWMELSKLVTDTTSGVRRYFNSNPLDLYYELATPVVTEIDLEGFPYIYKDGHIFLNSEIAPTTEIIYSINQCQQISASNEDIIRHEKELTYLQKLIAQYVQVDYESVLLSLKV